MKRVLLVELAVLLVLHPVRMETLVFVFNVILTFTFLTNQVYVFSRHITALYS